jgi:hypothetical protein
MCVPAGERGGGRSSVQVQHISLGRDAGVFMHVVASGCAWYAGCLHAYCRTGPALGSGRDGVGNNSVLLLLLLM